MTRFLIAAAVVVFAAVLLPLAAHASSPTTPPACVLVQTGGLHVQVGYAPNGPIDCVTVP